MVLGRVHFAFCVILVFVTLLYCDGQIAHKSYDLNNSDPYFVSITHSLYSSVSNIDIKIYNIIKNKGRSGIKTCSLPNQPPHKMPDIWMSPLPFPTCRADNIDCLRRSLRTFFFLMDGGHFGMQPVDPTIVNSIALSLPEQQTTFSLRRVNVTGARWTKLIGRRFGLEEGKNGVIFTSDLHLSGQISMEVAGRKEPHNAYITMDIHGAESNITYAGMIQRGIDNEDYIVIGPERIAVRNKRIPTYFLQPNSADAYIIDEAILKKPSILDHFSNEIVVALMHGVVDNFRLFSAKVPIKHYYKYYDK